MPESPHGRLEWGSHPDDLREVKTSPYPAPPNGKILTNLGYIDAETGAPTSAPGVLMGNPDEPGDLTPEQALTAGMRPLPPGTDVKLIAAVVDVLSRASCTDFEIAFDDEQQFDHAWSAHCELRGGEDATVRHWSSPEEAAVRLARKVLNGSRCASCARIMTLMGFKDSTGEPREQLLERYCFWRREGTQFVRGCRDTHTELQATEEAFAELGDE